MALNLIKGERISLTKDNPNLKKIEICLGWDVKTTGQDIDLDASAFLLKGEKLVDEKDVIFYNMQKLDQNMKPVGKDDKNGKLMHISGAVMHTGDDRTGAGDITHAQDKEIIKVDLSKLPNDRDKIAFVVTIYDATNRHQTFGMVSNAFIRVVDTDTKAEILRYNLTEDYSTATAIVVSEVYRHNNEFKFAAIGNGLAGGLVDLIRQYGMNI